MEARESQRLSAFVEEYKEDVAETTHKGLKNKVDDSYKEFEHKFRKIEDEFLLPLVEQFNKSVEGLDTELNIFTDRDVADFNDDKFFVQISFWKKDNNLIDAPYLIVEGYPDKQIVRFSNVYELESPKEVLIDKLSFEDFENSLMSFLEKAKETV